ncbi:FAD dependent oxidoreductase [Sistotremastrum suecicum HHB10207 ss-3]|uniref:FAD dependent oxidoreductase n=1 Tax=Sistotremastrum suecicum HHB10207 ss-3 TaxID=1314776 RepID=A0A166BXQ1_9AGAM|nr:FAD dependent oxidoreductase [Sistotremastrum suecicum HHB10207 ss-3]
MSANISVPLGPPASLPVPNPTKSFWLHSEPTANPLAKEGSRGPITSEADICIIGSGITGVSTAFHLSEIIRSGDGAPGGGPLKVLVLEARDFCINGGHLTPVSFFGFMTNEQKYGTHEAISNAALEEHTFNGIRRLCRDNKWGKDIDFIESGRTIMFLTEDDHQNAWIDFNRAVAAGLPGLTGENRRVEWLRKEEVKKRYGANYPAVRTPGSNLWPLKLVTKLYQKAATNAPKDMLVRLHTSTPVTAMAPISTSSSGSGPRWRLRTPRGDISCNYVVHATNGYASYLLPHMAGPKGIVPTRGQVVALRANAPAAEITSSGWTSNSGFEYWFPRPPKNLKDPPLIILGGGREVTGDFEFHQTDDSTVNPAVGRAIRGFLPPLFPGKYKEGREPEGEWTGILGYTKIGDPFVGPVIDPASSRLNKYEGQFIAAGYHGHGMPRAYACAEAVAQMIIADMRQESWTRPAWLPQHYLTTSRPR